MKKITLLLMVLSSLTFAKQTEYLGTFTIDNYPVKGCEIVKIGSMYSFVTGGKNVQSEDINKKGLIDNLSDSSVRSDLATKAVKEGFNAILGYKFYIVGGLDTFQGSVKNGNIAFGIYTVTAQGTPALIKCK